MNRFTLNHSTDGQPFKKYDWLRALVVVPLAFLYIGFWLCSYVAVIVGAVMVVL